MKLKIFCLKCQKMIEEPKHNSILCKSCEKKENLEILTEMLGVDDEE